MSTKNKIPLEERVVKAAEGALAEQGYVSIIDILTRIGYLAPVHVDDWCKGRLGATGAGRNLTVLKPVWSTR